MNKFYAGIGLAVFAVGGLFLAHDLWGTPKQREIRHLNRGNAFFDHEEYEKARIEYRNAARLQPADPEVDYRLGLVYEAEGDINNAFAGYSIAEQQDAHYHPALLKLANYYIAGEEYDAAQKRINVVLADTPDDPEAHALDASLRLHRQDFAGAEQEARLVLKEHPANITAISVLTGFYALQHNLDLAGKVVDYGIAKNPENLALLMLKARVWEGSGNFAKINETYQAMFRLKPDVDEYRFHLADIYTAAGRLDEAEATLREGIKAAPADLPLKHQLAVFLGDHRTLDAAEKEIRGFMRDDPANDGFYFWLADLYLSHAATDKAVGLLEEITSKDEINAQTLNARVSLARIHFLRGDKALAQKMVAFVLQKKPDDPGALYIRAYIAFGEGRYQDAVSDLRAIIHNQPKNKEALQLLSEVYLRQRHLDLATDTLSQLIEIDPFNYAAKVRLAQMYNLGGDPAHALQLLAQVTKAAPGYAVGWESLARVSIGMKDMPKAESAIRELAGIHGQEMISTFLQGEVQAGRGETDKAIASYRKIISADPSSPLAEYALMAFVRTEEALGKLGEATQYIESLKTNSAFVMTLLGKCYATIGKNDQAGAAFDKAIALHPADQEPYLLRASLYREAGKTDAALALLKAATVAFPGEIKAPLVEAHILIGSGKYTEAIALYNGMLERDPGFDLAANNLAAVIADYAYTDPALLDRARTLAERFVASSNPLFLDTLGWVYYRQGNIEKALLVTVQARQHGGKVTPQVHYHYGAIFLKAGKRTEAKDELQQSVSGKEDYFGKEDAKKMLGSL